MVCGLGYENGVANSIYYKSPLLKLDELKSLIHLGCIDDIVSIIWKTCEAELYIDHDYGGQNSVDKLVGDVHGFGKGINEKINEDVGVITQDANEIPAPIEHHSDFAAHAYTDDSINDSIDEEKANESELEDDFASPVGTDRDDEECVSVFNKVKSLLISTRVVNLVEHRGEKQTVIEEHGESEKQQVGTKATSNPSIDALTFNPFTEAATSNISNVDKERAGKERAAAFSRRYKTFNIAKVVVKCQATSTFTNHVLQSQLPIDNHQYSDEEDKDNEGRNSDDLGCLYLDLSSEEEDEFHVAINLPPMGPTNIYFNQEWEVP
ncbi:hypothetical protein SLEP1_g43453 [Rubroshorea leprosula]|uniref:Uncharacterized protein n=1 Tax=Rubroshorea leprosula TaxID=152421 RepID=A0AAV5LD14_9ROSI|nr:hypothetical protein SLEP1_g43453 [Rubroshorea leprosula]